VCHLCMETVFAKGYTRERMDFFEIEPYRLAGEHEGKWAMTITLVRQDRLGIEEQPFYGAPIFDSERDALRYGVEWVASRGGGVRKTVLQRVLPR
jgi:hypothetical protein